MAEAKDGVTKVVLALFLSASVALAQNTQATAAHTAATEARPATPEATGQNTPAPSTSGQTTAAPLNISYVAGKLKIEALDSTLRDILTKVAALTGVKIDIPPGASSERLPVVKLGPGPARQILAALLSASSFDYFIMASAADPEGVHDVLLVPREKKAGGGNGAELVAQVAPLSRGPDPRTDRRTAVSSSKSDETPEPDSPAPAEAANTVAQADPSTSAPTQPDQPAPPPPTQSNQGAVSPAALANRSGLTTEGAMSPPSDLSPQSINQQLQQMYQQRMQMTQQNRQSIQPPAPGNTESK